MKKLILLFAASLLLFSCDDEEKEISNACTSAKPLEEVEWLKDLKNSLTNCTCEVSLIKGTYDNQTVFFTALTDPICDGIDTPTLYDCEGNIVRTFTMNDYQEFYSNVTRDEVLYRCKTGE